MTKDEALAALNEAAGIASYEDDPYAPRITHFKLHSGMVLARDGDGNPTRTGTVSVKASDVAADPNIFEVEIVDL